MAMVSEEHTWNNVGHKLFQQEQGEDSMMATNKKIGTGTSMPSSGKSGK